MEVNATVNITRDVNHENVSNAISSKNNSKARSRQLLELERYSVASTVLRVPGVGIVVVPLTVFQVLPSGVSNAFSTDHGEIVYEDSVNVMMTLPGMKKSNLGTFNELSQTWTTRVTCLDDLNNLILRFSRFPTFLLLTLVSRKLFQENTEIQMVVCIQPKARCIDYLVKQLESVRSTASFCKNFYFEIDIGQSVVKWASDVLARQFACIGGRLGVTNTQPFNHVWDWQNILGCLPCICCCFLCGCCYRCHRAVWYTQHIRAVQENVIVMGSTSLQHDNQRHGLETLIQWTKSVGGKVCGRCGLLLTAPEGERCSCIKQNKKPKQPHQPSRTHNQLLKPQFNGVSWFELDHPADETCRPLPSEKNRRTDTVTPSSVEVLVHRSPLPDAELKHYFALRRNSVEPSPTGSKRLDNTNQSASERRKSRF